MAKSSGKKKKTNQKNKANASNTAREIGAVVLAVFAVWCFVSAIGKGGTVIMSPACASFGLFKNYKVRGQVFDKLVAEV